MTDSIDDDDDDDDGMIECWCGAVGTYEELFSEEGISPTCGGTGTLYCECGGDTCVCHHHGSVDCDGCVDCSSGVDFHDQEWPEEFRYE